jgi:hypothetical protein
VIQLKHAFQNGHCGQQALFITAGLAGFDSSLWQGATYAVRTFPLQCQENKNAF